MSKTSKLWLILAAFLLAVGLLLFAGVMAAYNWDFTKLSTASYQTNTHVLSDAFENISLTTQTADVVFVPSNEAGCRVVCHERETVKHTVMVQNGTLTIRQVDARKWYDYIGIITDTPKITVYVPETDYQTLAIEGDTGDIEIPEGLQFASLAISVSTGDVTNRAPVSGDVNIHTSTGDIRVEGVSVGTLDLSVSTGMVVVRDVTCRGDAKIGVSTGEASVTDVSCNQFASQGNTGDICLKNVRAAGKCSVERSTGDVRFDGCDANTLFVKTDTGDVSGTLLSEKVFITQTDTGRVQVPKTTAGGLCEITTDTGDIKITLR